MGYYNQIAAGYDELHKEEQERKLAIIKQNLDVKKSDRLLDVGCGTGISTQFHCECVGIDPSAGLLKKAEVGNFLQASAENIPFEDNSFDMVISVTAVHNFKDIERALDEIRRVAKDRVVLSILKKSPKAGLIQDLIYKKFKVNKVIMEQKDTIYFLKKKAHGEV